ncbi:MAG: TlpA disulfide reductase family protein [SAR202 cluster bacterium]|nr:TlpA disulfide reductase family protein [SAR202 cluster bacterium]MDP6512269.1 TlpA disulfide reductase family protein [SAR202 cluster bacterium]MDP6713394.1 TlpA disulfide reductase family protein [SAR202 cluster bacterium]
MLPVLGTPKFRLLSAGISISLVGLCLLLGSTLACSGGMPGAEFGVFVGDDAPAFDIPLVGGDTIGLEGLRGKGVIVNFWSTWCAPCVRELPLLDSVARDHSDDGLIVLAVNMGETEDEILSFLESFDLGFPIALDSTGDVSRMYGVVGLPMSVFIDGDGVVQYRRIGELREDLIARGLDRIL